MGAWADRESKWVIVNSLLCKGTVSESERDIEWFKDISFIFFSFLYIKIETLFLLEKEVFVYVLITQLIDCLTIKQGDKERANTTV